MSEVAAGRNSIAHEPLEFCDLGESPGILPREDLFARGRYVVMTDEELQALQRELTLDAHERRVGSRTPVLVEGASRRGGAQQQGRDPYNRVVNFLADSPVPAGTLCVIDVNAATPHSLLGVAAGDRVARSLPLA